MKTLRPWNPVAASLLSILAVPWMAHAQCAMCKTTLLKSAEGQILANGMNQAILFLISIPILIVCSISFAIFLSHRRQGLKNPPHPPS